MKQYRGYFTPFNPKPTIKSKPKTKKGGKK